MGDTIFQLPLEIWGWKTMGPWGFLIVFREMAMWGDLIPLHGDGDRYDLDLHSAHTSNGGPMPHYHNGKNVDYGFVHNIWISFFDTKKSPPRMDENQCIINQIYYEMCKVVGH